MSTLFAKALQNVTAFQRRVREPFTHRYHRILDERDSALAEALINLEKRSDDHYPAILQFDTNLYSLSKAGGAVTGLVATGTNLVGDSTFAEGSMVTAAGKVDFTAVLPGVQTITVTITDTGAALGVTADAAAGTIDIVHGAGGSGAGGAATAAELEAAVNADAVAMYMVLAAVGTAGDVDADETVVVTTANGAVGQVPEVSFGAISMDGDTAGFGFTAWTDTTATFDLDPSGLTVGDIHMLRFRIDGVLVLNQPCLIVT